MNVADILLGGHLIALSETGIFFAFWPFVLTQSENGASAKLLPGMTF